MMKGEFPRGPSQSVISSPANEFTGAALRQIAESTLSAESTESVQVVYPNPASDYFDVRFSTSENPPVQAQLYDELGRIVKSVVTTHDRVHMDVKDLPVGMYHLRIMDGKTNQSHRVVISR